MSHYNTRRLLASLVLCPVALVAAFASPPVSASRFDPSGDYHIADRALAASASHAYFDLDVRPVRGKLIAWGHVCAKATRFPIRQITLTRSRLAFATRTVRGVSYRFDGRFTRGGVFADQFLYPGLIAAHGTLTRVVNGSPEASVTSEFLYYPGC